jgi:hypothetical protein
MRGLQAQRKMGRRGRGVPQFVLVRTPAYRQSLGIVMAASESLTFHHLIYSLR